MSTDTITTYVRIIDLAEFEIERAADGAIGRTITGQAVPYGVPVDIPSEGIREQFDHGAFAHQLSNLHRVPLTYRHQSQGGEVVGRLASGEELATGLRVHAQASDTTLGRDVLTLVRDGAVTQLSVGFRAKAGWSRVDGTLTRRQRANLFEVAIVPEGAYGRHAAVTGVRSMGDMLRAAAAGDDLDDADDLDGLDLAAARALVDSIPLLSSRAITR
jgi:uncharacterized protein